MLAFDSLVTDLLFLAGDGPDPEVLIDTLGGEEVVTQLKVLDPDMQDPRFEMELSPSRPFRRRGERRLMIIDDSVAPMRADPQADPVIALDLRPAKAKLVELCQALADSVRIGRLFALGSWGEAVIVARSAIDLRAWMLQGWVLDPTTDVRGKRRGSPLTKAEFEEKLAAYEPRLAELTEADILAGLPAGVELERVGEWLVLSVLDGKGHWDLRKSLDMEQALAAVERFSLIPGAPQGGEARDEAAPEPVAAKAPEAKAEATPAAAPAGPPLTLLTTPGRPLFRFPPERFDLEIAARLGKGDWSGVLTPADADGPTRDRVFRDGAGFVAPLEFLSEVFLDGKPLSKPVFEERAETLPSGARTLQVHFPRFGPALLVVTRAGQRFITSETESGQALADSLGG